MGLGSKAADDVILAAILIKLGLGPAQVTPVRPKISSIGAGGLHPAEHHPGEPAAMAGCGGCLVHRLGTRDAKCTQGE